LETPAPNELRPSLSVIVLDSSAIASIFFKDKFEQGVAQVILRYDKFSTVDVAYAEVGSVAWKSVILFKEKIELSHGALKQALAFIQDNCEVVSSGDLLSQAFELGTKYNVQIYDSLFLVLAKHLGTKVLTTDERLCHKLNSIKELRGSTVLP
jgi:predicted nucleic acid-binding protein